MVILAVYGVFLAALTVAVFFKPSRAVAGVLCLYPLKQWAMASDTWLLQNRTLTNYAMAVIVIFAVMVAFLRRGGKVGGYTKVGWLTFALYAFAASSYAWTISEARFIEQWGLWWPYVVTFLPLVPLLIRDADDAHDALIATMAFAALLMPLLMFSVEWRYRHIVFVQHIQSAGAEGNPLAIASMCGYAMLGGTLMMFRRGLALFWQIVRWSVVVFGFALMIRSGSRGPLFAVVVALLVFLPMSRRIRNVGQFFALSLTGLMLALIALWAWEQYANRNRWEAAGMIREMLGPRFGASMNVLNRWAEGGPVVWLFGFGNSGSFNREVNGWYPEVVPAEVFGELGLFGFAIYASIVAITFAQIPRVYRLVKPYDYERGLFASLAAIFVFELLQTFKGGSLLTNTSFFIFAILLTRYCAFITQQVQAIEQEGLVQPVEEEQATALGVPGYGYWPEGARA
jgi:hypothetical protein